MVFVQNGLYSNPAESCWLIHLIPELACPVVQEALAHIIHTLDYISLKLLSLTLQALRVMFLHLGGCSSGCPCKMDGKFIAR